MLTKIAMKRLCMEPFLPTNTTTRLAKLLSTKLSVAVLFIPQHFLHVLRFPLNGQDQRSADFARKNPFGACPATGHPISLTHLQVSVGGVNQPQSALSFENFVEQIYTFENFVEQIT